MTVPARLAARARERPGDTAIAVIGVGRLSYGSWERRSTAVAQSLVERGLTPGARVVLVSDLRDLLSVAVAYVAVQKAGGTPIPVPRAVGRHHLEQVCMASRAAAVIGDATIGGEARALDLSALEGVESSGPLPDEPAPQDAAEILYTSGTTGTPKGVVVSHENLLFTHSALPSGGKKRTVLHSQSPGTQVGQGLLVLPLDGAPHEVVVLPEYDDGALIGAVERHEATDLVMVPVMALSLIHSGIPEGADVSSVRVIRTTSAPIAPTALHQLAALFPDAAVFDMYSTTQAWPARTRLRIDRGRPGSVGRSEGPALVRIVEAAGTLAGPRCVGYVELKLPGAPRRRYVDGEVDAAGTFQPDGWVRTGDLGYLDEDQYLYLVDRDGDSVNSGGVKISTLEVERVIEGFPGVREAAVVGVPSPTLGEYAVAAVRASGDLDLSQLGAYLDGRLGAQAPKRLVLVDDFPRGVLGKVLKRDLRAALSADDGVGRDEASGSSEVLSAVRQFWAEALGVQTIPADTGFLALGGNSISTAAVLGRVQEELGRAVGHRDLFDARSVGDFARRVEGAEQFVPDELGPVERVYPLDEAVRDGGEARSE